MLKWFTDFKLSDRLAALLQGNSKGDNPVDALSTMRQQVATGVTIIAVLGGSATAWASLAKLESAVVSQGVVVVEGSVKKVQHPTGGVVGKLLVKEGQRVNAGDLLISLDDTATRAQLAIVDNDLSAFSIRHARLVAERDDTAAMEVPKTMAAAAKADANIRKIIASEQRLLESRRTSRLGQKGQLSERIVQLKLEIVGTQEQLDAASKTLKLATNEFKVQQDLLARGLTQTQRVTALEREVTRTVGQIGELTAKISQLKGKITETDLQISQVDRDMATEVQKDMREAETKITELSERRIGALDVLTRVDIRAPSTGAVNQLAANTVGGVVTPQDVLMIIVPDSNRLEVEVQLNPQDIDQIGPGLPARVRFTAFNRNTTPEIQATLYRVGADRSKEQQTGRPYFSGGVSFTAEQLAALGKGNQLVAGMPAEVYIRTGERTFASYLFKSMSDFFKRGIKEK
jgi:HlyD family secretion protein